jgi:hypothetical protein
MVPYCFQKTIAAGITIKDGVIVFRMNGTGVKHAINETQCTTIEIIEIDHQDYLYFGGTAT